MSPSSSASRDPLDEGNAPWTEQRTAPIERTGSEPTTPLPAADTPGRTGVASGRLHPRDPDTGRTDPVGDEHLTPHQERISATAAWDTLRPAVPGGASPVPSSEELRARQKKRFGGLQVIPGLFGWLAALSVSGVLLLICDLAGPQWGVHTADGIGRALGEALARPNATVAWLSLSVFGVVEFLALLAGGYVAARMARFSGVRQGVSVWLWSLLTRALASVAVVGWADAAGRTPHGLAAQSVIGSVLGWGLVALAAVLVLDLIAAALGGAWGMRYHRKVDAWTVSRALTR